MNRTIGILESTSKLGGPSVKRFVLLGSAVAVLNSYQDIKVAGKDYTEADWNPVRKPLRTVEGERTIINMTYLGYWIVCRGAP